MSKNTTHFAKMMLVRVAIVRCFCRKLNHKKSKLVTNHKIQNWCVTIAVQTEISISTVRLCVFDMSKLHSICSMYVCWHLLACTLHWRQNDHGGVSNQQPHGCVLNRLFRRKSKKTPKLRVTVLCVGNSPHKGPVTRKMVQFDDVIMTYICVHDMPTLFP